MLKYLLSLLMYLMSFLNKMYFKKVYCPQTFEWWYEYIIYMYKYIFLYGKHCNKMFPVGIKGIVYLGCVVLLYHLHLDATRASDSGWWWKWVTGALGGRGIMMLWGAPPSWLCDWGPTFGATPLDRDKKRLFLLQGKSLINDSRYSELSAAKQPKSQE